ncbi:MAG: hypothetical protein IPP31_14280 [Chitinophagaceae bacterium]|nr:hypothetical protein [Chitinophagaceae bacterium]
MAVFISFIIYRYQKYQNKYYAELNDLKSIHKNEILQTQIEIQEQTFQNISREIHDNIGQKLTLAKLHLNTTNLHETELTRQKLDDAVTLIGEAITDLSDISRSMGSELILSNGLIKALEFETEQLKKSGLYKIELWVTGDCIFLDAQKELIIFRIVQEALTNIIKHANANFISINMHFSETELSMEISDNGTGFLMPEIPLTGNGLNNMRKRALALHGLLQIMSQPGQGTTILLKAPYV